MELLIAILLALGVYVNPTKPSSQIQAEYSVEYAHAETIIETNAYHIDSGVVIIDDGTGD